MKKIINNRLYDTEKCEELFSFRRQIDKGPSIFGHGYRYTPWVQIKILKTPKGFYLEHNIEDDIIKETDLDSIRKIIKDLNPDRYLELFGCNDIEEA